VLLARKNLRLGRGDRRGATRLALAYFAVRMVVWLFAKHHNGLIVREFDLFLQSLGAAVFNAGFMGTLYLALEPFVRRRWPRWIISWSRLLTGGYRDPLVGRDILIGAVVGVGMILTSTLAYVAPRWIGRPPTLTLTPGTTLGVPFFLRFPAQLTATLFIAFIALFLLLLFVLVLRRERLALLAVWLLIALVNALLGQVNLVMMPFAVLAPLLVVLVLYRYGLLATISSLFFGTLWVFYPMTTELTAWYAKDFAIALVICVALALYGFYISLAGQPLFGGRLLED
jgi:serine/threonine-protein kinase